jgi:DNA-directed RNA polymerase III subunit RPC4
MTASGPFALGPSAMSGSPAPRRGVPRSSFMAPVTLSGLPPTHVDPQPGAGPSGNAAPSPKKGKGAGKILDYGWEVSKNDYDDEMDAYSDPDEGVEIVDMDDVRQMDWMAPEVLRRDRAVTKKKRRKLEIKSEPPHSPVGAKWKGKGKGTTNSLVVYFGSDMNSQKLKKRSIWQTLWT